MSCPRCEGSLIELSLGDHVASICEDCGHVGIATDLQAHTEPEEPWEETIRRFKRQE